MVFSVLWSAPTCFSFHLIRASGAYKLSLASTKTRKKDRFTDKFQHKSARIVLSRLESVCVCVGWHVALFQQNKHIITWTRDFICLHRVLFTEISYAQTSDEQHKQKMESNTDKETRNKELKRESYGRVNWIYAPEWCEYLPRITEARSFSSSASSLVLESVFLSCDIATL